MQRRVRFLLVFLIFTMLFGVAGCSRVSSRFEEKKVEAHFNRMEKEIHNIEKDLESIRVVLDDMPAEGLNQAENTAMAKLFDEFRQPIKVIDRLRPPEILEELHAWFIPYVKILQTNTNQLEQGIMSNNQEIIDSNYKEIYDFFAVYNLYHDTEATLNELGYPLDAEKLEWWSRRVYIVLNKSRIDGALIKAKLLGDSSLSIDIYKYDNEDVEAYIAKIEKLYALSEIKDTQDTPEVPATPPDIVLQPTLPQENNDKSDILLTGSEIFPDSDVRRITDGELKNMELFQLNLAKNEIYARHGYVFKNILLKYYFSNREWYYEDTDFNGELNTEVEKANMERIAEEEERRKQQPSKFEDVYEAWYMVIAKHMPYSNPDLANYQPEIVYSEPFYIFPSFYFTPDDITGDMMYAVSLLSGNVYQYYSNGDISTDFKYDKELTKGPIVEKDITTAEANELLRNYVGTLEYIEFFEGKMDSHYLTEGSSLYTAGNDSCFYYGTGGNTILYIVDKKYGIIYEPVYEAEQDLYYLTRGN